MRTPLVFDSSQAITRRKRTKEGYLLVPAQIAASDNVQPYFAKELGLDKKGLAPNQVVRVFRPKAEVDKAASTFDGLPVTLEHPKKMVDSKIWRAVARGESHGTRAIDTGLESNLVVRDEQTIEDIEQGRRKEVSAGYDFHIEMTKGTSPKGEAYDAIASDFVGNHIAITKLARGGHDCRVADSNEKGAHMRVLVFDAMLLGTATPTQLPEMEDNVASAVDTIVRGLASARDTAIQERDAVVEECRVKLETQATDSAKKLKDLEDGIPARVMAEAKDRATVLAGAEKLGIKLQATDSKDTVALRREVLTEAVKDASRKAVMDAMVPDLAKATPEALSLATAALFALVPVKTPAKGHDSLSKALVGKKDPASARDDAAACAGPSGRESMMTASAQAWKRGKR